MKPIYDQYYYPPHQPYQQQQHPGYNTATPFMRRAFHDAIYEEEYGSESEEECCRGRGFSAVLCWFLSVIILIGLAASVVLTVFFILKSRSFLAKNNGDLDVLYEGDQANGLVYPPTTDLNFDLPQTGNKRTHEDEEDDGDEDDEDGHTTSSTKAPPGRFNNRRNPNSHERNNNPAKTPSLFNIFLDGMQKYENDFPLTPSKESFVNFPKPASEEIISNESQERRLTAKKHSSTEHGIDTEEDKISYPIATTERPPPVQQVLFTIPPSTITTSPPSRRNIQTTRFSYGRPSSTIPPSSEKPKKGSKEESNISTNARYNPYGTHFGRHTDEEEDDDVGLEKSTVATTKSPEVEGDSDEAQLKKMLLEEIPPHKDSETRNSNNVYQRRSSKERTSFTSSTTTERPDGEQEEEEEEEDEDEPVDTLARIIKNLAPKWGREKSSEATTIPPPTVTSPSASRYNVTMTSRDRSKSRESSENNSADGNNSRENGNSSRQRYTYPKRPAVTTTKKYSYNTPDKSSTTTVTPDKIGVQSVEPNLFGGFGEKLGVKRGSNEHPIEIMKSPDLSKKYGSKETENNHQRYGSKEKSQHETEGEFIDVLVGADNHKTLVTKQTADGIVTSAILPPWYDGNEKNDNISDVMKMNGTSLSNPAVKSMNDSHSEEASTSASKEAENTSYPRSEFDLLLNLFSQSPLPKKGQNITSMTKKHPENVKLQATIVTIKPKTMQTDESTPNRRNSQATRKTPNFKDLMKDLLPGLTSTGGAVRTRSTTVKPPQVSQANNAFHVGSKDGTTDIYGYYPDEETEPDKYVETHHIESEKLSDPDEILDDDDDPAEESPSHVIDVSYHPSTRPEIIIEPDDDGTYDSSGDGDQFSSGSNLHHTIVPAPADEEVAGGGIRRPLSSEEEMEFGESDPELSVVNATSSTTTSEAPNNANLTESPEIDEKSEEPEHQNSNLKSEIKAKNELIEEEESEEPPNRLENRRDEERRNTPATEHESRRPTGPINHINKQFTRQRPEESKISEELKPAPTRYDPRQNIIRNRKKPQPKVEERRRHPSIESVEDQKPPVNFFEAADPPPAQASPEVQLTPATGASYEEYETEEEIPPENETETETETDKETGILSEEQNKDQTLETDTESNEVTNNGTNDDDPDYRNAKRILDTGTTEESVKEPISDEEQEYDKSYQAELSAERHVVAATEASTGDNRIHRVYSVSYDPTTTESPNESNQQLSTTTPAPYPANPEEKKKTFVPPKPENFHENKYMFSQQIPDTNVFQSKDGWRPVVYDRNRPTPNNQNRNQNSQPLTAQPTPPPTPTYYSTAPLYSSLTGVPSSIIPSTGTVTPAPAAQANEDYEEEEEDDAYDEGQTNQQENQPDQEQWSNNNIASNTNQQQSQSKLTIKPSQPIPSPPTPQIKFPENGQEAESSKQSTPQPQQTANQPQSSPDSIDRSKYLVRPAPPPIVMRRTPHSNMPYLPPRPNRQHPTNLAGNKPPQQFVHSQMPPPSQQLHKHGRIEYPHPPHPMNTNPPGRPGPGRFKHLNAGRPRGNIQWPTEDDRRKLFSPNRRLG